MAKVDYATLKKGGFMRQKQKNNFSLRLACVGGTLTAENLKKIAEVAEKYGDGYVHLTSRQGVEIPFIKLDDIDDVKDDLAKGGCKPGVCGPRVRTVTACQGNAVCPSGNINSYDIAVKLNERYFGRELPHKFKFGVTGCQNNCLKAEENDVGIKGAAEVSWKEDACIHCGVCEKACRENAISFEDDKLVIDTEKCNYCGRCAKSCPVDAWDVNEAYIVSGTSALLMNSSLIVTVTYSGLSISSFSISSVSFSPSSYSFLFPATVIVISLFSYSSTFLTISV